MKNIESYAEKLQSEAKLLDQSIDASLLKLKRKKKPLDVDISESLNELIKIRGSFFCNKNKSFRILKKPEKNIRDAIKDTLKESSYEELLKHATDATLELMKTSFALNIFRAEHKHLLSFFKAQQTERIENFEAKNDGRAKKFEPNTDCLFKCLQQLKNERDRELQDSDFARFSTIVISNPAPYQSKPRETAEEKKLAPEDRKINLEQKMADKLRNNGWASTTISRFWEKETGLKATKKKLSTHK
jgi:hypothetical protein